MTWADFYLVCFVVGLFLTVVMFFAGAAHLPHLHIRLPGTHGHFGIGPGASAGHGSVNSPTVLLRSAGGNSGAFSLFVSSQPRLACRTRVRASRWAACAVVWPS